ncbi:hypothetical protein P280DRAFT_270355 [Massarina eburnea CBS 473.64]|uniref:Uncharacterized protein n=1 Tax=Massarina eburnea CBS 473.64 TaxID=1395130 RepID=A0A6A6S8A4_9PLEO|nr:hypothetical protein P280DRAFT_270355 [Massarina eburnea CBS 473.64]
MKCHTPFDNPTANTTQKEQSSAKAHFESVNTMEGSQKPDAANVAQKSTVTQSLESNKRQKTGTSFFYGGPDTALHPSLLHPPTQLEQENNILITESIGKKYQLAVKDYGLSVRNGRIRAKDRRITELEEDIEAKEAHLLNIEQEKEALMAFVEEQEAIAGAQATRINELITEVTESMDKPTPKDVKIRALQKELEAQRAMMKVLEDRHILDKILGRVNSMLGRKSSTTAITTAPQKAFPFMKLPSELRNNVYKHCLVSRLPIDLWPLLPHNNEGRRTRAEMLKGALKGLNVTLMRTSKQVHYETVFIMYGCNRFRFSDLGCWTVLEGFLLNLNRNCHYLTNIEIGCPDWFYTLFGKDVKDTDLNVTGIIPLMKPVLDRFKVTAGHAIGPSTNSVEAYTRALGMMLKLPNLNRFKVIVPFNAQLFMHGIYGLERMLTGTDEQLLPGAQPCSTPTRTLVFLERPFYAHQFIYGMDVDDDELMNRDMMLNRADMRNMEIQYAEYGMYDDWTSYIIDGEDGEYDVEFPEYEEEPGTVAGTLIEKLARYFWH